MLKAFGSARPRKDDSESWDDLLAMPKTERYLEDEPGLHANTHSTSRSNNHRVSRAYSPIRAPKSATRDDDNAFSPTCGSRYGSSDSHPWAPKPTVSSETSAPPQRPPRACDNDLAQLTAALHASATVSTSSGVGSRTSWSPNDEFDGYKSAEPSFGGFGTFKNTVSPPKVEQKATVEPNQSFGGFGTFKNTVPPPKVEHKAPKQEEEEPSFPAAPPNTPSFGMFAPRPMPSAGAATSAASRSPPSGGVNRMFQNAMAESARATAPEAKPSFGGFGTFKNTVSPPKVEQKATVEPNTSFGGFGTFKNAVVPPKVEQKATVEHNTSFGGFGTFKNAVAPPKVEQKATVEPNTSFGGFGTFKNTVAPPKVEEKPFSGFGTFKNTVSPPKVEQRATIEPNTSFSGFGTIKNTVSPPKVEEKPFSGFGTFKNTVSPPKVEEKQPFSGFGTFKNAAPATPEKQPFAGLRSDGSPRMAAARSPVEMAQANFGTFKVSGPAKILNALREKEREEQEAKEKRDDEEAEKQGATKKRVQFQDVHVPSLREAVEAEMARRARAGATHAAVVKEEGEIEDEESDSDDSDDTQPTPPWGYRPCFWEMLAGGTKKLVLMCPPSGVTNYFTDQVFRSYGCTYDNKTSMFFATSPGLRGQGNGQVMAMSGNCVTPPVCVARDLVEPAAIAVYEPGLSVCVVTNRGIFVLTRQVDDKGAATGGFLSRQISLKGYHRGIAATAGGGIVSFSNGRIRMFDGSVSNGEERVLTETNYELIINNDLFPGNQARRSERANCCFMDIVEDKLVMSDLQKHVISLWRIDETRGKDATTITLLRAIDVAVSTKQVGKAALPASRIPPGKCCYASGIRMDAAGWVMCADADGRTIQIFDNELKFVTRIEPPQGGLPYISGLYIESGGHLMVCDRKSEMGGLRVYMLEGVDATAGEKGAAAVAGGAAVKPNHRKEETKSSFGGPGKGALVAKPNYQNHQNHQKEETKSSFGGSGGRGGFAAAARQQQSSRGGFNGFGGGPGSKF